MTKLFIVHGVGSFQEQNVLKDVGRLAAGYGIDSGGIYAFNWDREVNRVFGVRSFNIDVLSEISAGTLNAANLGFLSGEVYAGIPKWWLVALNAYAQVIQVCGILWLPALIATMFSYAARLIVFSILATFLTIMLLTTLLSKRRWEALRTGFRRLVLMVLWPLLYSAAVPLTAALLLGVFILGMPVIGFFINRFQNTPTSEVFVGVVAFSVLMLVGVGSLLLFLGLQKIADPILKILSDIFRYIGVPPYRTRLQQKLTDFLRDHVIGCDHVVILAHSLGSVMTVDSLLSNPTLLANVARVDLVTMGSPLKRMFYGGFPELFASPERIWASLASSLNNFRWINVYRPLDVIGARISTGRCSQITELNTRECLKNHTNYWSDVQVATLIHRALVTQQPAAKLPAVKSIENWRADLAVVGYPGWLGKIWRYRAIPAEAEGRLDRTRAGVGKTKAPRAATMVLGGELNPYEG